MIFQYFFQTNFNFDSGLNVEYKDRLVKMATQYFRGTFNENGGALGQGTPRYKTKIDNENFYSAVSTYLFDKLPLLPPKIAMVAQTQFAPGQIQTQIAVSALRTHDHLQGPVPQGSLLPLPSEASKNLDFLDNLFGESQATNDTDVFKQPILRRRIYHHFLKQPMIQTFLTIFLVNLKQPMIQTFFKQPILRRRIYHHFLKQPMIQTFLTIFLVNLKQPMIQTFFKQPILRRRIYHHFLKQPMIQTFLTIFLVNLKQPMIQTFFKQPILRRRIYHHFLKATAKGYYQHRMMILPINLVDGICQALPQRQLIPFRCF